MKIINQPIKVMAIFHPDGKIEPIRFRLDEKSAIVEKIIKSYEEKIVGNKRVVFVCLHNEKDIYELKYEIGSNIWYLGLKQGDFIGIVSSRKKTEAQKAAGVIRKVFGSRMEQCIDREKYEFCWIVDFPMYEIGDESGKIEFCHNPFSMPQGGLKALEEKDPLDINAYQYDLVCNGVELSSGAVRNHDPEIMVKAFNVVGLGENDVKAKFPAMYNAFCYGAPPHAGIAPGVDRMVMILSGEESIREIIPFPMNKNAQDIMMGAPSIVEQKQLDDVHIKISSFKNN